MTKTNLHGFEYWYGDVLLNCWLEFEPADRSVGLGASAWLVHAYVGDSGADIVELLRQSAVERIEEAAVEYFEEGATCRRTLY